MTRRDILAVPVACASIAIAFALLASWLSPCLGMIRFEPCIDPELMTDIQHLDASPCYLGICDYFPSALSQVMRLVALVGLLVGGGWIAATLATRRPILLGAIAGALAPFCALLLVAYLYPYGPPDTTPAQTVWVTILLCAVILIVGASFGASGGWLTTTRYSRHFAHAALFTTAGYVASLLAIALNIALEKQQLLSLAAGIGMWHASYAAVLAFPVGLLLSITRSRTKPRTFLAIVLLTALACGAQFGIGMAGDRILFSQSIVWLGALGWAIAASAVTLMTTSPDESPEHARER
jgi:hypothetical protein